MLERRVTYRRRASYRTKGNKFIKIKTPGGKLGIKYLKKKSKGNKLSGIKIARPADARRMRASTRTVTRAYGGVLNHREVRDRITRAFMIEEINSIKQKAAVPDKTKKKGKKKAAKGTKK